MRSIALYTLVCAALPGCFLKRAADAEPEVAAYERSEGDPIVLHVRQGGAGGAGTPLSTNRVATAAHVVDGDGSIMVDGRRMEIEEAYKVRTRAEQPNAKDYVVLRCREDRFDRDRFRHDWTPETGDVVRIGGFRIKKHHPTNKTFARLRPEYVDGTAFSPDLFPPGHPPSVFWAEFPDGDYAGFSGGPAAIVDETGKPVVVGIVIKEAEVEVETTDENGNVETRDALIIGILRLPEP